jgi:aminopeptidase N
MSRRWLPLLVPIALLAACTAVGEPPAAPLPTRPPSSAPPAPDGRSQPVTDAIYPEYGNPAVDVLRYALDLSWDPQARQLTGTATLTLRAVRELGEIALDFSASYTVDKATVDGAAARPTRRGGDLVLAASRPLATDATATVVVGYRGRPEVVPFPGARQDVDTIGLHAMPDGALWAMQEPYGAFTWYPCSDQPSDEALYDIAITVPAGWTGVANGVLTGTTEAGGRRTFRWHAVEAMPTYLVTLAVDHFTRYDDTGPHGLPVSYWVRPQDQDAMLPTLRQSPRLLSWLERRLGPYPFSSAGVVVVQDRSGMETQTMITLGPLTGPEAVPVLLHEYSHHWFGDSVTPRTWQDVWLNEGFATYVQGLFQLDEHTVSEAGLLAAWRRIDTEQRADAGPPGHYKPERFAARNVYVGPALMLHELRGVLGDPTFFAMLHDWAQHNRHTQQDRVGFTAWLNAYTGRDLTPIVDKWLDSPVTPGQ